MNAIYQQHSSTADKSQRWKRLQSLLAQLRKAANHPYLFPGAERDFAAPTAGAASAGAGGVPITDEGIVTASGKMMILDRLLAKLHARGHRVVLFSQFTRTLDM